MRQISLLNFSDLNKDIFVSLSAMDVDYDLYMRNNIFVYLLLDVSCHINCYRNIPGNLRHFILNTTMNLIKEWRTANGF